MGHQVGLGHSNVVAKYDDVTSYMGFGARASTWPRQTFNGPHNWFLGWYEKRTMNLDPLIDNPQLVHLAALVDFQMAQPHQPVILVVGTGDEKLYLQYNRAKGFNNQTRAFKDWVTVHTTTPWAITTRKGGIRLSEEGLSEFATDDRKGSIRLPLFTATNFSGSGRDLLIQVCEDLPGNEKSRPDVIVISVGIGKSLCNVTAEDEDDNEGDSFSEKSSFDSSAKKSSALAPRPVMKKKDMRTKSPSTTTRPMMKKKDMRTKAPSTTARPMMKKKKRMMRRTKAPAITIATPSESPLTKKEFEYLRGPSRSATTASPASSPSASPISSGSSSSSTTSPSVSPTATTASPTRDVPGGSSPTVPFPTNTGSQDSYSYMYIVSGLLAALGIYGVFMFVY
jgi:hypothetical protein